MKYFIKGAFSLLMAIVVFIGSVPVQAQNDGTQQLWFSSSETENIATPMTEFNAPAVGEEFTLYVVYHDINASPEEPNAVLFNVHWNNNILQQSGPAVFTSTGSTAQFTSGPSSLIGQREEDLPTPFSGLQADGISDGEPDTDYAILLGYINVFAPIFPNSPAAVLRVNFRWRADATKGATSTRINLPFREALDFNAPNQETTSVVINAPSTNTAPIADAGDNQ